MDGIVKVYLQRKMGLSIRGNVYLTYKHAQSFSKIKVEFYNYSQNDWLNMYHF